MSTKKNEPMEQPAAAQTGMGAEQPSQMAPDASAEGSTTESETVPGTPFDALAKQQGFASNDGGYGAGVWHNNKRINALWTKAETRNSWLGITDLGWKKINPANDTAVTAITMIAASALETQTAVNVLLDNNLVVEIYNW